MIEHRTSLIVIQCGHPWLLWSLLTSLGKHYDKKLVDEVIIVNNGLSLDSENRMKLQGYKNLPIKVVDNSQKGYASGVNRGAAIAQGDILIIANNDIEWLPGYSVQSLLDYLWQNHRVGVVGPQLVYPDSSWQRSYGRFPSLKEAAISLIMLDSLSHGINAQAFRYGWGSGKPKKVDYIDGAFMVVRKSCFEELGGFDESYTFYGEDADFCWRAWEKGWKVVFIPDVRVMHIRGASSTSSAPGDYAVQLFQAKQKFVREHYVPRQARWYGWCIRAALYERSFLYSLIARLSRSPGWQQRASQARARWSALKKKES